MSSFKTTSIRRNFNIFWEAYTPRPPSPIPLWKLVPSTIASCPMMEHSRPVLGTLQHCQKLWRAAIRETSCRLRPQSPPPPPDPWSIAVSLRTPTSTSPLISSRHRCSLRYHPSTEKTKAVTFSREILAEHINISELTHGIIICWDINTRTSCLLTSPVFRAPVRSYGMRAHHLRRLSRVVFPLHQLRFRF